MKLSTFHTVLKLLEKSVLQTSFGSVKENGHDTYDRINGTNQF